jgi:short-subunit dehydrogenase
MNLLLIARSSERLEALALELRSLHPSVVIETAPVDLSAPDAGEVVHALVGTREVGLLVLNAGANNLRGPFLEQHPEDVQRAVNLAVHLSLALVRELAGPMASRGRGGVLSLGSLAGFLGQPQLAVYSADKAWQRIFFESLWLELQPYGVDGLHLVLGVTRTPAMERAGLDFDTPGLTVASSEEVAAFALQHLAGGPVLVVPGNEAHAEARSSSDRARLVTSTARRMGTLLAPSEPVA